MELTDRKKQILKIVVESYINTAEPVGSKAIVEQMPGKISSATIRNELADLVEMGYLEQPHTSAGRVPSARGYRLYVNELMERKALSPEETAKINDALSGQMKQVDRGTGSWRTYHYAKRNGNVYPTHGLGPIAQYMNLARKDDCFGRLVSFSSPALGRAAYAKKNFPADHKWNKLDFACGDMNTSIIKTTMGRTILVEWDETSPRPYSRLNLIQGTLGTLAGFPTRVAGEKLGNGNYHEWIEGREKLAAIYEKYDHPLWKRIGNLATKMGGHGGMDFVMLYRIIECLRKGEPMDQNVYEGAFWSSVSELSEYSVAQGGMPQVFPDFTRGDWKTTAPLGIVQ